jgi:hypothetical protein
MQYDRTLLVADPRHAEPKKWVAPPWGGGRAAGSSKEWRLSQSGALRAGRRRTGVEEPAAAQAGERARPGQRDAGRARWLRAGGQPARLLLFLGLAHNQKPWAPRRIPPGSAATAPALASRSLTVKRQDARRRRRLQRRRQLPRPRARPCAAAPAVRAAAGGGGWQRVAAGAAPRGRCLVEGAAARVNGRRASWAQPPLSKRPGLPILGGVGRKKRWFALTLPAARLQQQREGRALMVAIAEVTHGVGSMDVGGGSVVVCMPAPAHDGSTLGDGTGQCRGCVHQPPSVQDALHPSFYKVKRFYFPSDDK